MIFDGPGKPAPVDNDTPYIDDDFDYECDGSENTLDNNTIGGGRDALFKRRQFHYWIRSRDHKACERKNV